MNRLRDMADKIAHRIGYTPTALVPTVEITWESGKPPHVLIEPPGCGGWMNRVVGYVFPTIDGITPSAPLPNNPCLPVTLAQICPGGNHCICDSRHES